MALISFLTPLLFMANISLFFLLLVVSILKLVQKDKFSIDKYLTNIKFALLGIACFMLLSFIVMRIQTSQDVTIYEERLHANPAYLIMHFGNLVIPFILLIPQLGRNIFALLFVSFCLNIGWVMEMVIIAMAMRNQFLP